MSEDHVLDSARIAKFQKYYRRCSRVQILLLFIVLTFGFTLLLYASVISYQDTWREFKGGGIFSIGVVVVLFLSYWIKRLEQRINLLQTFEEYQEITRRKSKQRALKEHKRKLTHAQKLQKRETCTQEKIRKQKDNLYSLINTEID